MYLSNLNIDDIEASIEAMSFTDKDCLVAFVASNDTASISSLSILFNKLSHPAIGGVFPGLIKGQEVVEGGILLIKVPCGENPILLQAHQSEHIFIDDSPPQTSSGLIFIDGLSPSVEGMLNSIFNRWGGDIKFFGGGCGFMDLQQKPCLITKDGVFENAAIIVPLASDVKIGVRHGWEQVVGPLVATRTQGNDVVELNWEPAYQVYKNAIFNDSGIQLDDHPFFDIAKQYPFGIFKEGSEDMVRDPIARDDDNVLKCVGHVPENTMLYVLKGESEKLIKAAEKAAYDCMPDKQKEPSQVFVFDCISRRLFLEDAFEKELEAVGLRFDALEKPVDPVGALSIGEVSTMAERELAFFNKTIVVGATYV
ncbi:MAG: FIST C-terminal domain-containing protein [Saprospiraceae bacterium]|nr:FIST C-terminal domain-containing protein [Saprospiraceae bacterium]